MNSFGLISADLLAIASNSDFISPLRREFSNTSINRPEKKDEVIAVEGRVMIELFNLINDATADDIGTDDDILLLLL